MASQQSDLLSVYQDILRNLTVNWQRAFSPTINFGCNVQDVDVEQHVLNSVGSYGKQLNRIIDLLGVLLPRVINERTLESLTPAEEQMIVQFEDLARRADEAAFNYQGKQRREITEADVDHVIHGMRSLERSDHAAYAELLKRIHEALPPPNKEPSGQTKT